MEINVNGGTCIPDSLSTHIPCPRSKLNPKNSLKMRSASNSPTQRRVLGFTKANTHSYHTHAYITVHSDQS